MPQSYYVDSQGGSESIKRIHDRVVLNAKRLKALYATGLLDSPPDRDFDRLTELTARFLGVELAFITLIDADRHFFLSMHGVPEPAASRREAPPMYSFCQHVVVSNHVHAINDVLDEELVCQEEVKNAFGIISYLGTPLRTPDDQRIGSLCVIGSRPRYWTEEDKRIIEEMGELVVKEIALRYHTNEHVRAEKDIELHLTALEEANAKLERKNQALIKANAVKSQFLATMSHEIRTPMNGVIGFTSLLSDTDLDLEQSDYVETIRVSGEALLDILSDVLDYAAIDSRKIELNRDPFSIHHCVSEALDVVSLDATQKGLELGYYLDPDVPEIVVGDSRRIRQILVNLLSNAVKFTNTGEIVVEISLDPSKPGEDEMALHFVVRDTGIGISRAHFEMIFESFTQVNVSIARSYGGTGLGLSICKSLCEYMGGKIWVESEENVGSAFHFTVQVRESESLEECTRSISPALKNRQLLISVISESNRKLLRHLCDSKGIGYCFVDSNAELDRIREERKTNYDFLFVDLDRSDVSLHELVGTMKRWSQDASVVLLQNFGSQEYKSSPFISGIVNKPIKRPIFYRVLSDGLRSEKQTASDGISRHKDQEGASQMRILVAEDNYINQKLILRFLDNLGYRAEVVANGQEVLQAIGRCSYDAILMDVNMPEMDGIETTKRIRTESVSKDIYIIGITAAIEEEIRKKCQDVGMDDLVHKPITATSLGRALNEVAVRKTSIAIDP